MAIQRIVPGPRLGLNATPSLQVSEAASQTFTQGAPVRIASGRLQITGANEVGTVASSNYILGFAQEAGNNTSAGANSIGVNIATENQIFTANVQHATSASLRKIVQTDLGANWGLTRSTTTNNWFVDKAESSASKKCVKIVSFVDAVSTSQGRVNFVVRRAWRQHDV